MVRAKQTVARRKAKGNFGRLAKPGSRSENQTAMLRCLSTFTLGLLLAACSCSRAPETPARSQVSATSTNPMIYQVKGVVVELEGDGKTVRIGGICKGAGMIQPGMSATGARPAALHATMLCFITTDAAIESKVLQAALRDAVAQSFNRVTVDGDMSTNDACFILANGSKLDIHNIP
jgi:hypothetical protein